MSRLLPAVLTVLTLAVIPACTGTIESPTSDWTTADATPTIDAVLLADGRLDGAAPDTIGVFDTLSDGPPVDAASDTAVDTTVDTAVDVPGDATPSDGDVGPDVVVPDLCEGVLFGASQAPIRRLSQAEYNNTVASLFPGVSLPAAGPLGDDRIDGFLNNVGGQSVSPLGVQTYRELAENIGTVAVQQLAVWAPCTDDTDQCITNIALDLAPKAYRRPLDTEETNALTAFASAARSDHGFNFAATMVVQVLLESPLFLYRPEFGSSTTTVANGSASLTAYEMASRLSYFFLQTMPDEELFARAADGTLTDVAVIEQQALRLLQDPRARPVLTGFFSEWLRVYKLDELSLDPVTFPEFGTELVADMQASLHMYLDKVLWQDDAYDSLFGGTFAFVNDRLAPLYGMALPGSNTLAEQQVDATQRRGVLTQVGLLASTSHGIGHSPIFRGVTMLSNMLCTPSDPLPDGILDNLDPIEYDPEDVCTTRDHVTLTHTARPGCEGCHTSINGAGFAFENYDALGRFRTTENGCPIDASGEFPTADFGDVDGAVDLATKMQQSAQVAECMTANLFSFGLGRSDTYSDYCEIRTLAEAMKSSGGSLQGLIVALVTSPSFRSRPAVAGQ